MSSKPQQSRFAVVERDGYSETELFEADSIEKLHEFLEAKGGR